MSHKDHWFKCCHCGYIGEESELPHETEHECGDDKCPKCNNTSCIICCFTSYNDAEIEHHDGDDDCCCPNCDISEDFQEASP